MRSRCSVAPASPRPCSFTDHFRGSSIKAILGRLCALSTNDSVPLVPSMGATQGHLVAAGSQGVLHFAHGDDHVIRMARPVKRPGPLNALPITPLIIEFHIFKILSLTMLMVPLDWNLRE